MFCKKQWSHFGGTCLATSTLEYFFLLHPGCKCWNMKVKVGITQTFKTHHVIMVFTDILKVVFLAPLFACFFLGQIFTMGPTWHRTVFLLLKAEMEFRKQAGRKRWLFLTFFEERTLTSVIYWIGIWMFPKIVVPPNHPF